MKRLRLGIIGGGPGSWIGHVHRIASRFDDKYEVVAGVFSRNYKVCKSFGVSIGLRKNRCYKNYKDLCLSEKKIKDGIQVVAIMTPPGSHQEIAEFFIKNNIHVISDKPFAGSLKQAQKLGFAEANPKDDISGTDTAYKLSILSNLAFGINTKVSDIYTEGINKIEEIDIKMAQRLGYRIVLLGIANLKNYQVMQRVHPCLVSNNSMIAKVDNELNTIIIEDQESDKVMVIGKGAGKNPTAASVMADIININDENKKKFFVSKDKKIKNTISQDISKREGRFYIRMGVDDKPGVLADITLFFKKQKISIKTMFQLDNKIKNIVPLIFVTHKIAEKKISLVLKKMESIKKIKTKIILLRIEEL